jgi:hypothetical protein
MKYKKSIRNKINIEEIKLNSNIDSPLKNVFFIIIEKEFIVSDN